MDFLGAVPASISLVIGSADSAAYLRNISGYRNQSHGLLATLLP